MLLNGNVWFHSCFKLYGNLPVHLKAEALPHDHTHLRLLSYDLVFCLLSGSCWITGAH